ncbi:c-type cytochrome [Psychroserpens luteolus]|uniref:c-type cytochrome n=1 Tax=Psychroserpens luteolus TaxID=2855840 RepID=UPI001E4B6F27|nr:cytochrome c [Psychroserpens luteolus]MCD2259587.1 c-type cytochrome [Psychroserpens luteolus]
MEAIRNFFTIVTCIIILVSCSAEEGPIFIETDEPFEVSFSADIQPIFTNHCIQCHNQNHPTGLDLRDGMSYDLLINVSSTNYAPNLRIEPFSIENSVLWHKIIDDGVFGQQMPPIGDGLSNFEIQKIEEWIIQGALND